MLDPPFGTRRYALPGCPEYLSPPSKSAVRHFAEYQAYTGAKAFSGSSAGPVSPQ